MRETGREKARTGESGRGGFRLQLRSFRHLVLRICGMPDYEAYLQHLATCHPGCAVPSERQFFDEYLKARYEGGQTRCC